MRFLIDNALSPVSLPCCRGPVTTHCMFRTIGPQRAQDIVIFDKGAAEDRILVSADTDFGALLAARNVTKPSVIQFRGPGSRKPDALSRAILSNLSQLADALERGSIVTFEPSRVRVRALPINTTSVD